MFPENRVISSLLRSSLRLVTKRHLELLDPVFAHQSSFARSRRPRMGVAVAHMHDAKYPAQGP